MAKVEIEKRIVEGSVKLHALLVVTSKGTLASTAWVELGVKVTVSRHSVDNFGCVDPSRLGICDVHVGVLLTVGAVGNMILEQQVGDPHHNTAYVELFYSRLL